MSAQSADIIRICPGSEESVPGHAIFSELNELIKKIILPDADSLFTELLSKLTAHIDEVNNNHDMMCCIDTRNILKSSAESIKKTFIDNLLSTQSTVSTSGEISLELLDNSELDQRLTWLAASNQFENKDNAERISRIKTGLKAKFPEHQGTYPATPERLCESFSIAISVLEPEKMVENHLFIWFLQHFKKSAGELWRCVEDFLINEKVLAQSTSHTLALQQSMAEPKSQATMQKNTYSSAERKISEVAQAQAAFFQSSFTDTESHLTDNMITGMKEDERFLEPDASRVAALDLAKILSSLQQEIVDQHRSIKNLHNSVLDALKGKGEKSKLFRHHEAMINMTGWLFDYILADENLPDDLKKILSLLQIPILKQAILDKNFLTNDAHPARQLLNTLTRSRIFQCNDNTKNHVLMLIEHTVRTIVFNHDKNPDIFQECLEGFKYNLALILESDDSQEETLKNSTQSTNDHADDISELTVAENDEEEEIVLSATKPDTSCDLVLNEAEQLKISSNTEATAAEPSEFEEAEPHQQAENQLAEPVIVDNLHVGQWVEFIGEGDSQRLRCQLLKLSKDKQRYIFVNSSGMRVAERSGHELKKGVANGTVQILEESAIFDRAINAILHRFRKS